VKVPGSFIPLTRKDKDHISELDFIGQVRNSKGRTAASVRDTLTVKVGESGALEWSRRHLSYDTGFALPPGRYKVKFLARENQTGKIGTFEAGFEIPDLNNYWDGVRLSTVVLSGQREPATAAVAAARDTAKLLPKHPLVKSGEKLVPSITRVFRRNKNLYVYFEVYDPREEFGSGFDVAASLSLFRGRRKVFEAPALRPREFIPSRSRVVPFEFEVPLGAVVPGEYVCQVNVVDQAGGRFAFRRAPVVVLP
jgi:hypothetical protein